MRVFETGGDGEPRLHIVILIIHRFHIGKLNYSLKFICKPGICHIETLAPLLSFAQSNEKLESADHMLPAAVGQGDALFSPSCSYIVNKCPFGDYTVPCFCIFVGFFVDDFTSYNAPQT